MCTCMHPWQEITPRLFNISWELLNEKIHCSSNDGELLHPTRKLLQPAFKTLGNLWTASAQANMGIHLRQLITPIHLEITPRFVQNAWESMDGKTKEKWPHLTQYLKYIIIQLRQRQTSITPSLCRCWHVGIYGGRGCMTKQLNAGMHWFRIGVECFLCSIYTFTMLEEPLLSLIILGVVSF